MGANPWRHAIAAIEEGNEVKGPGRAGSGVAGSASVWRSVRAIRGRRSSPPPPRRGRTGSFFLSHWRARVLTLREGPTGGAVGVVPIPEAEAPQERPRLPPEVLRGGAGDHVTELGRNPSWKKSLLKEILTPCFGSKPWSLRTPPGGWINFAFILAGLVFVGLRDTRDGARDDL